MSNTNIFKIKILEPSFFECRPHTAHRPSTAKKHTKGHVMEVGDSQVLMPAIDATKYNKNNYDRYGKNDNSKQLETFKSYRSSASCSHRTHKLPPSH